MNYTKNRLVLGLFSVVMLACNANEHSPPSTPDEPTSPSTPNQPVHATKPVQPTTPAKLEQAVLAVAMCPKIDRLEIRYSPDPRPNNPAVGYSKTHVPTAAESDIILNTKLGIVDGKPVTIRDYFQAQKTGGGRALLDQDGILEPRPKERGAMTSWKKVYCNAMVLSDNMAPLPIDWSAVYSKPAPKRPLSIPGDQRPRKNLVPKPIPKP